MGNYQKNHRVLSITVETRVGSCVEVFVGSEGRVGATGFGSTRITRQNVNVPGAHWVILTRYR